MKRRAIRVQDLPALVGTDKPRPLLFCEKCGGEYSAERGDYFMLPPDAPMACCRRLLRMVYRAA